VRRAVVGSLLPLAACGAAPEAARAPEPALVQRARDLQERALRDGRAYELLSGLLAAAPSRLSGSPGADAAVAWGLATMRELGLRNVRAEEVMVPKWVRGQRELCSVLSPRSVELSICALGGSVATSPAGLTAEVLEVRSLEELRTIGDAAQGRIVFVNRPMPRAFRRTFQAYGETAAIRTNGASEAAAVGAVAVLVRSLTTSIDDLPHTGAMLYRDGFRRIPAAAISTQGAETLSAMLREGPVRLHLWLDCQDHGEVPSANVVGELVGSELPDEIVLLGAHLDAWDLGHGAHDDGAGCAHVLEAMRLLQAIGHRPRRTIRGVLFMNEENGLRGALGYAERHRAALEAGSHVAAIETDAGGFAPEAFTCSLRGAELEALRGLFVPLSELGMGTLVEGGAGGADIAVLAPYGTALFGLMVASHRYFDYHHTAADRLEAVNERELALGAAALAYAASVLADR
jgi:carboxypeptidase Q